MLLTLDHASRISPGSRRFYTVRNEEVAVLNVDGTLYAIRNSCPHMGGPLGEGRVFRRPPRAGTFVSAFREFAPGTARTSTTTADEGASFPPSIACPLHGWEFDLADGTPSFPAKRGAKTYEVRVEDDLIKLEVPTETNTLIPDCGAGGGCRSGTCSAAPSAVPSATAEPTPGVSPAE